MEVVWKLIFWLWYDENFMAFSCHLNFRQSDKACTKRITSKITEVVCRKWISWWWQREVVRSMSELCRGSRVNLSEASKAIMIKTQRGNLISSCGYIAQLLHSVWWSFTLKCYEIELTSILVRNWIMYCVPVVYRQQGPCYCKSNIITYKILL
jgi:hypothetical protein